MTTDASTIERNGFEFTIIERFAPFLGLGVDRIEGMLGIFLNRAAKGYRATLAR